MDRLSRTADAVRIIVVTLMLFAVACFAGALVHAETAEPSTPVPSPTPSVSDTPNEDEPGWDCRIHGDRKCG